MAKELDEINEQFNNAKDDVGKLKTVVGDLIGLVKGLTAEQKKYTDSLGDSVERIGDGKTLFIGIGQSLKSVVLKTKEFATDLKGQYKLTEKLAESYKQTSVNIGIGFQNQKRLGEEFNKSVLSVQKLGGEVDDVSGIYTRFAENSGRVRILAPEEVERIFAIEKATGLLGDSATALAERFDLMGIGSEQFADNINQVLVDSQKLGLNSSKVVKVLSDNFENMQRMSFRGGVKAMTEMSKLAVKMRMDVSRMLGMADKFYEPEAAIEAAAQLQLMGGDIAEAFGDPFETMYLARNKPEELAKKLQVMTENMVAFNEETGQYELPAEARQQLSFVADQLDLAKENVIDMAFQSSKMKDIKLSVGGDFTEEQLDKISSIAKYKDGQWKIDVEGQSVAIDELDSSRLEKALEAPTTEKDAAIETAKASMTTNQHLEALLNTARTGIAIETKFYEAIEKGISPNVSQMKDTLDTTVSTAADVILENKVSDFIIGQNGIIDKTVGTLNLLTVGFQGAVEGAINKLKTSFNTFNSNNKLVRTTGGNKVDYEDMVKTLETVVHENSTVITKNMSEVIQNNQSNQNVTHNGTIKVEIPTITFNMGDGNESVNLTTGQKKTMQNMIISNMVKGMNSNIQSGTGTDGTTNVLSPEY